MTNATEEPGDRDFDQLLDEAIAEYELRKAAECGAVIDDN